ncbi:MAG: type II secretion system protein [Phycisphaerae bacterium]|nr:type II secretion system protein [Phycisphaerae bacterium]
MKSQPRQTTLPDARNRQAFTLIELLVVIAIISLLVSILLPSLQQAKELAKRTACQTQLRSIASSFTLYASEENDAFPMCCNPSGSGSLVCGYSFRELLSRSGEDDPVTGPGSYQWYSYWPLLLRELITPQMLYCPSDEDCSYEKWFPRGHDNGIWNGKVGYAYRGTSPPDTMQTKISRANYGGPNLLSDETKVIVADRFIDRTPQPHKDVYNVVRSDAGVTAVDDSDNLIHDASCVLTTFVSVRTVWEMFDEDAGCASPEP